MKETNWSKFKLEPLENIRAEACRKVMSNEAPVFYVIVNPQGAMRDRVEAICGQIDASRGLA